MHSINKAARDGLGLKHRKNRGEGAGDSSYKGFLAGHLPKPWGLQKHLYLSISVPLCEALAVVGYCCWELLWDTMGAWGCDWAPPLLRAASCPCQWEKITDLAPKRVKLGRKLVNSLMSPRGCPQSGPGLPALAKSCSAADLGQGNFQKALCW